MLEKLKMKMAFNLSTRLRFYRIMKNQTDGTKRGVKTVDVLQSLIRNEEVKGKKTTLSKLYRHIKTRMELSKRLGEILQEFVPVSEASQIYAAEISGRISNGFAMASEVAKQQKEFKAVFKEALVGPTINVIMAFGILAMFFNTLVPSMTGALNVDNMSVFSQTLLDISEDFNYYLIGMATFLVALIAWTIWALPNYNGKFRLKLEKIPPFSMYRLMTGCSFLYAMNSLNKSGVPQNQALGIIKQFATPYLKLRINKILSQTDRSLGEALLHLKMDFPDREVVNEIAMASEQGVLVEAMPVIVENLGSEGLELIKLQAQVAKVFAMLIMAGAIMILLAGMSTFLNDIQAASGM
jgi:type II secretory pathway component PulF